MYSPLFKDSSLMLLGTVNLWPIAVPQAAAPFSSRWRNNLSLVYLLSTYKWYPYPSRSAISFSTIASLFPNFLMYSCSSFDIIASFPKNTKELHKYPLSSDKIKIFMPNLDLLFGIYSLNPSLAFQINSCSSIDRFLSCAYVALNFSNQIFY